MGEIKTRKYGAYTIKSAVGELASGGWHAVVKVDNDETFSSSEFLEVPPGPTEEEALALGWKCAEKYIDALPHEE